MNDKGNRYALSALKNRRAPFASEIVSLERQMRHCKESLVHVDATLRLLDESIDIDAIPNKRPPRRVKLFRHCGATAGGMGRSHYGILTRMLHIRAIGRVCSWRSWACR